MKFNIPNFVSPHVHQRSLDSASTPDAFAKRELELGTGYLVTTDHGSLAAAREVFKIAKQHNLTPIIGLEGYLRDDNCPILGEQGISGDAVRKYNKYFHVTTHFRDEAAFETAVKCLSEADLRAERHGSESKPLFTWEHIERMGGENTVFMSSCLIGVVQRHLLAGRPDLAIKYYEKIRSVARPGNFYVEVFPHKCDKNWVNGVICEYSNGRKQTFWLGKKLRTNKHQDITASDLVKEVAKHDSGIIQIIGIKNGNRWDEIEPLVVVQAKIVQDFIQNECHPWCPDGDVQLGGNKFLIELANKYKDKIVVSDDSHYANAEDKIVQDIRLLSGGDSWRFYGSYHRQSSDEAFAFFKSTLGTTQAEFEKWVENSHEWASGFKDFKFKNRKSLPVSFYPKDTLSHVKNLVDKHGRMDWNNPHMVDRLKKEIKLLKDNGTIDLLPYFFLAEEVCSKYEEAEQLTGPGRGSAAGVLLTYLLGITHVNPLDYDLSLERFITHERIASGRLPDIDQDLPSRDLLVGEDGTGGWLKERFGDYYAQISTDTVLKIKSSIKDVCRAKRGYVLPDIEEICKKIPNTPQGIDDRGFVFGYKDDDKNMVPGIIETEEGESLRQYIAKYPEDWEIVLKLLKINRQKSRHASAYVIADEPISNFIPLTTVGGVRVTQYTANWVEEAGGVKMDYLVVNSLKDIQECIRLIQSKSPLFPLKTKSILINGECVPAFRVVPFNGKLYDVWKLPEDISVFNDICEGKTETVFQLNTVSAQKWLREFNYPKISDPAKKSISSIEDISAFTALDRPGPLDAKIEDQEGHEHNMLQEFALRARGASNSPRLGVLDHLLPETYGIIVYQEQLQKAFQKIGQTTAVEANTFREKIAKKKMEEVLATKPKFMTGAIPQIGEYEANELWDMMKTFGQYGFNKSHSVSYSHTAYACAFLKKHFELEWWCAVLKHADKKEIGETFWKYCGHLVDLPDINDSGDEFEIQNGRIRAPIEFLKGIGEGAHKELCNGRPYKDIEDLCQKIAATKKAKTVYNEETGKSRKGISALNKGVVSKLIISGAMDSLFPPDTDLCNKLMMFNQAMARADGKKKADPIDEMYLNMNVFQLYQLRKEILSVYNVSLLPKMPTLGYPEIQNMPYRQVNGVSVPRYKYVVDSKSGQEDYYFVTAKGLKIYEEKGFMFEGARVALVGYISDTKPFIWNGTSNLELTFEVEGDILKLVKWADRRTRKHNLQVLHSDLTESQMASDLKGAIVIALLNKFSADKPFSLKALVMVQPPLSE